MKEKGATGHISLNLNVHSNGSRISQSDMYRCLETSVLLVGGGKRIRLKVQWNLGQIS